MHVIWSVEASKGGNSNHRKSSDVSANYSLVGGECEVKLDS